MGTNLLVELDELEERCNALIKRNVRICQRAEALLHQKNALILRFQSLPGLAFTRCSMIQEIEALFGNNSDKKAGSLIEPSFESFLRKMIGIYENLSELQGSNNPLNRLVTTQASGELGPYARIRGMIDQQESIMQRKVESMDLEEASLVRIKELLDALGSDQ